MFRGVAKSKLDPDHFGAGSTMKFENQTFLVVGSGLKGVCAVRLETFEISRAVDCEDPNFLTSDEARALVNVCAPEYAFSDGEYNTKGMKK